MQRRDTLAHLILAIVVVLGLTDAQAQIAFVSNRVGNHEIYVMNTDGSNQRRLTNHPARDYSPAWSPGGKRIAFVSRAFEFDGEFHFRGDRPSAEIYVMDVDGAIFKSHSECWQGFLPHGPLTVNGLPMRLIGMSAGTMKSM